MLVKIIPNQNPMDKRSDYQQCHKSSGDLSAVMSTEACVTSIREKRGDTRVHGELSFKRRLDTPGPQCAGTISRKPNSKSSAQGKHRPLHRRTDTTDTCLFLSEFLSQALFILSVRW